MYKSFLDFFNELEPQFSSVINDTGFPKYNMFSYKDDINKYKVELALAGYSKDDIGIKTIQNKLIIECNSIVKSKEDSNLLIYGNAGISKRAFSKTFEVNEKYSLEVESAEFINGLLSVIVKVNIPEEFKPKEYKIK